MKQKFSDFRALLKIDKHSLDKEIQTQPEIFYDVSEKLALAISRRDAAYEDKKQIENDLSDVMRAKLTQAGGRVTNAAVETAVKTNKKFTAAVQRYLKLAKRAARWEALKEAFRQRSFMLGQLTALYEANYFTSNSAVSNKFSDQKYEERKQKLARGRRAEDPA